MSLLDSLLGGYVYAQQNGAPSAVPSRKTLIFAGATVTDDGPTANSTTITISGGGGSFPGGDLCSGTGTSVSVGSGLVLSSATLSAPSPFVHASTQLLDGTGAAVTVSTGLSLVGGTLSADNQFTGTSLQLSAGDGSAITVGSGLTLAAGTITAAGGGGGASVGTFAARPASGTTGQVYVPTDEGGAAIYDGSAWRPMVDQYLCKRVDLASLTPLNMVGAPSATQWGDAVFADFGAYTSGINVKGYVTSASSSVVMCGRIISGNINSVGAILRESITQKAAFINMVTNVSGSFAMTYGTYTSDASRGSSVDFSSATITSNRSCPFVKIEASGTTANYFLGYSPNGPWQQIATIAGVWTTAPDQGGIIMTPYQANCQLLVEHLETA